MFSKPKSNPIDLIDTLANKVIMENTVKNLDIAEDNLLEKLKELDRTNGILIEKKAISDFSESQMAGIEATLTGLGVENEQTQEIRANIQKFRAVIQQQRAISQDADRSMQELKKTKEIDLVANESELTNLTAKKRQHSAILNSLKEQEAPNQERLLGAVNPKLLAEIEEQTEIVKALEYRIDDLNKAIPALKKEISEAKLPSISDLADEKASVNQRSK